jgi:hypothetical protein
VNLVLRQNRRNLIVIFITTLIIFEMIAYVVTTPRSHEQFFQFYVLGANHLAADYYPQSNSNIRLSEKVEWYIGVTDLMGNVQLVSIRVKLGNETISPPNDTGGLPSPAPLVTEFMRFIQNNETWELPFAWLISNFLSIDGSTRILELQINNQTFPVQGLWARNGYNFRLIFELWTWDVNTAQFQFGWHSATERRVAWLQLWFNATLPPS